MLACAACGDSLQAADRDEPDRTQPEDPALRAERERLTLAIADHRQAIAALRAEHRELDQELGAVTPGQQTSPQAEAWRLRQHELRMEVVRLRELLDARLDEIAALGRAP